MTRWRGFVTARLVIDSIDFAGTEDVQFTIERITSPFGERLTKQVVVLGELFGEHLIPESRDDCDAVCTTSRKVPIHGRVIQVLVYVCDNYPVGNTTTFFPAGFLKRERGNNSGFRIGIRRHWPQFDLGIPTQDFLGIVGRLIVVNDVSLNKLVIMQKKEGQHVALVPAARIKIYFH